MSKKLILTTLSTLILLACFALTAAGYGCVKTYANLLGLKNIAKLLEQTLQEEKDTDVLLTGLAESINIDAEQAA